MYDTVNGWKTPFILLIFNISISPHLCRSDHAWDSVQYIERYPARYNIDWTQYNGRPPSTTTWSLHTCVTGSRFRFRGSLLSSLRPWWMFYSGPLYSFFLCCYLSNFVYIMMSSLQNLQQTRFKHRYIY